MEDYRIDEKKMVKRRLNFYNVDEKIVPTLDHLLSKDRK